MTSKKKIKRIEYFKRKVHRQKQQQWRQMVIFRSYIILII
jgi:hypothetical protein